MEVFVQSHRDAEKKEHLPLEVSESCTRQVMSQLSLKGKQDCSRKTEVVSSKIQMEERKYVQRTEEAHYIWGSVSEVAPQAAGEEAGGDGKDRQRSCDSL